MRIIKYDQKLIKKTLLVSILAMIPVVVNASGKQYPETSLAGIKSSYIVAASENFAQNDKEEAAIILPEKEGKTAVTANTDDNPAEVEVWKTGFEVETNFNTKDWMIGFGAGMEHMSGLSLLLRFQIRPLENTVFVEKSENVYRQYNETRMVFGLTARWDYIVYNNAGVYANAGYGLSFGYFHGSDDDAEFITTPMLGAGFVFVAWEFIPLRCGYEYIKTPDNPDHHINLSASFFF